MGMLLKNQKYWIKLIPFHTLKVTSEASNIKKYSQFLGHLHHSIKLFQASKHFPREK